ncbi:hypothetical protein HDV01_007124 [Terramyces sp. JEL0728]|nr:hypothetical protein HDV01_007124 [Terramyces sp. JEL0728]
MDLKNRKNNQSEIVQQADTEISAPAEPVTEQIEQDAVEQDAIEPEGGMAAAIVDSIFTPGYSSKIQFFIHFIFVFLFFNLLFLYYMSRSWHVIFLIGIATCLWASLTWFLYQLKDLPDKRDLKDSIFKSE